jgi:EmrB/QacA subfamily drug resistance transporter
VLRLWVVGVPAAAVTKTWPWGRLWTLAVSCLAVALVMAAVASLTTTLPELARDTGASQTQATWIVDAYTLVLACLLLPAGAVGDRRGRRGLLLAGLAVFAVASAVPVVVHTPEWVIVCRAVSGLGAALVMPATLSILSTEFPAQQAARAVGVWAGFAGAGGALGLLGAGTLLAAWSWQSVFAATALLALVLAVGGCFLPASRETSAPRLDVAGAALSAVAVGLVVFGVIEAPDHGWTSGVVLAALCGGVLAGAGFVVVERRRAAPLLDVRLFGARGFGAGSASMTVQFLATFGVFYLLMQHLQLVWGYSPLHAGLALAPMTVPLIAIAVIAPWLAERVGLRVMTGTGLALITVALVGVGTVGVDQDYPRLVLFLALFGAGLGTAGAPATTAILRGVPREKQGVASAVNDATREIGAAVGIALAGSLLAGGYRAHLTLPATGLPAAARSQADNSLAAALQLAARTPGGERVAAAARLAFVHGMHEAYLVLAVLTGVATVVLALWAPGRPARAGAAELPAGSAEGDGRGGGGGGDEPLDEADERGDEASSDAAAVVNADGGRDAA